MRTLHTFAFILTLANLTSVEAVEAQTKKTVPGQHHPTPYITYAEFQDISIGGEIVSGKSSGSQTTFRDILTVASLDEVTRRFGEPTSTEYNRFPEGSSTDYTVYLTYNGLELKYRKREREIKLETMALTSKERFLRAGRVKLQPGMGTDSLSPVMHKAIQDDGDGVVGVKVAQPGKSEDSPSILNSETEIQIWTKKNKRPKKEV